MNEAEFRRHVVRPQVKEELPQEERLVPRPQTVPLSSEELAAQAVRARGEDWLKSRVGAALTPGNRKRRALLAEVEAAVCRDRQQAYGDAEDNFANIAAHLNLHFLTLWGKDFPGFGPADIAIICAYIKMSRLATSPRFRDNWVDLAGYAICGGGIVSPEGLIHGNGAEEPVAQG